MPPHKCPECNQTEFQTDGTKQETICKYCGLVLEDSPTEHMPLDRTAASHPALSRAGTYQYDGKIVKNSWFLNTREKNLREGRRQINLIAGKLTLPKRVITEANLLFQRALNANLTKGRDNASFIYASVYMACLIHSVPKTPLEVTAFSPVTSVKMLRAFRILRRELAVKTNPIDPQELVQRFGTRLELSQKTISRASELLDKFVSFIGVAGCRPETFVASALYVAARENNEPRTQRQVANTVGVIEVTIRKKVSLLMRT